MSNSRVSADDCSVYEVATAETNAPAKQSQEERRQLRTAVAHCGGSHVPNRRLSERFQVPGAMVLCSQRSMFGFWKKPRPPLQVCDLGIRGLTFRDFGAEVAPGSRVKLRILLPERTSFCVKGKVVWNKTLPEAPNDGTVVPHLCGIDFTDYGVDAWQLLCEAHAHYGTAPKLLGRSSLQGQGNPS